VKSFDVAVIGGGIIGTAAAAYLAEAGQSVILVERTEIAAGASGRNSGAVQHPFDPVFATLHDRSLELYRDGRLTEAGFELPERPGGLMLVSFDQAAVASAAADLAAAWPSLKPEMLPAGLAVREEPALHPGVAACRIETCYAVAPATATHAFAVRARRAGAELRTDADARVTLAGDRATGVGLGEAQDIAAETVLVAAGPWTPALVPGWAVSPPITSIWGVVVSTTIPQPPSPVLEELGVEHAGAERHRLFSLITAAGATSLGSTFLAREPDPALIATELMARGQSFVPALKAAPIGAIRSCARPVSFDGRPLIGAVPGVAGLFVCGGHGPWGISTGPASAEMVARQMLGIETETPALTPARFRRVASA
jgi:glycine/D-amino acid oxidase-like deaminating enzyme